MFSVFTNIYNKKTKEPTATGKLKKFIYIYIYITRDVWCVHHGWHGTHRYDVFKFFPHTRVKMSASIFFTAAMIRSFRSARSCRCVLCVICTKCMLHSNHSPTRVIFQHAKRLLPGAAIFSLPTLTSPSGRNVNYDEKQLNGEKILNCSFYLQRFRKYMS